MENSEKNKTEITFKNEIKKLEESFGREFSFEEKLSLMRIFFAGMDRTREILNEPIGGK